MSGIFIHIHFLGKFILKICWWYQYISFFFLYSKHLYSTIHTSQCSEIFFEYILHIFWRIFIPYGIWFCFAFKTYIPYDKRDKPYTSNMFMKIFWIAYINLRYHPAPPSSIHSPTTILDVSYIHSLNSLTIVNKLDGKYVSGKNK